jgi:hypothetical protein
MQRNQCSLEKQLIAGLRQAINKSLEFFVVPGSKEESNDGQVSEVPAGQMLFIQKQIRRKTTYSFGYFLSILKK